MSGKLEKLEDLDGEVLRLFKFFKEEYVKEVCSNMCDRERKGECTKDQKILETHTKFVYGVFKLICGELSKELKIGRVVAETIILGYIQRKNEREFIRQELERLFSDETNSESKYIM